MKIKHLGIILAAALSMGTAFASQAQMNTSTSGFYVEPLVGYSQTKYKDINDDLPGGKENSFAAGLDAGYQFNKYFATEIGGLYFADTTITKITADSGDNLELKSKNNYAIYAALKGMLPISNSFSLFAKLGAADSNAKEYVKVNGISDAQNQNKFAFLAAAGATYHFQNNWSVSLEALGLSSNGDDIPQHVAGLLAVGYQF